MKDYYFEEVSGLPNFFIKRNNLGEIITISAKVVDDFFYLVFNNPRFSSETKISITFTSAGTKNVPK